MKKKNKNLSSKNESVEQKKDIKKEDFIVDEITISIKTDDNEKKDSNKEMGKKNKKKRKKKNSHIFLKFLLALIITTVLVFAGLFIKRMNENGWTMGGFVATILGHDANTLANLPRINILLVGQSQNLTDTILVCSYDPKIQDAVMMSIPRDTFIGRNKNAADSFDKINAIYQIDPEMLVNRVRDITGLNIDYYVKVDTEGLRELVDSVGGIYFNVPIDMDYDDPTQDLAIHLKAGYQLLDGDKAEQVVRFRHNNDWTTYPVEYGEQDIGRMRTQREFLTEVIKQLAKPENVTKIDDYIKIANKNVATNFTLWNLKDYAPYLIDFKTENLKTATLPGAPEKYNNLWFYAVDRVETKKLVKELFKTELTDEQEKNASIKVNVLNGTNNQNNLTNVQNLLKENGYTIVSVANTTSTKNTTIINRTNQDDEVANKLKDLIGLGMLAKSSDSNESPVDFTIIIGDDY